MSEADVSAGRTARHGDGDDPIFTPAKRVRPAPAAEERDFPASLPELSDAPGLQPVDLIASQIGLRVHTELAEIERDWKAFERHADCTVFQSFDWVAKWHRHIGASRGVVPAIVVGRSPAETILFILQLAIEPHRLGRRLTWLASELCDYNAPLLAEDFSYQVGRRGFPDLWRNVLALLRAKADLRFDFIDLEKMPEAAGRQSNPFLALPVLANPSGAYVCDLPRNWDSLYAAKRSSQTRKRERRQIKQLAEHGELRFVDVRERADVERTLATLFAQKTQSFERMGVDDIFARAGYRDFLRDVATDPDMRDLVHVSRLDVGNTMAAENIGLTFRSCYYLVLSSYEGELARFGPGRVHLHELLRHAIERGFTQFDFTIGDEPYKRDWSDTELRLFDYLGAATIWGAAAATLTAGYRRAKRTIKQNPALWRVFSKARALRGLLRRR